MKLNYLKIAAYLLIVFEMGVIFNEFLFTHYGELPDYLKAENLSLSRNQHLVVLKTYFKFFLAEIMIAILLFIYLMKSNLAQISELQTNSIKISSRIYNLTNDNLKNYMPVFLLFLSYFIRNYRVLPLKDSIFFSLKYSAVFYIIFEFSYYWINLILLGWLTIQSNTLEKNTIIDNFLVSNDILPKIIRKWFKDKNYIFKTYYVPMPNMINLGVFQEDNLVDVIIFGDWKAHGFQKEFKSVLFHELGHINYQACFYHRLWLFLVVTVTMLGYFYIYKKFLKSKKDFTTQELIYLFLYLNIIMKPLILVSLNGFRQYHEYLADSYVYDNGFKKDLKRFFKKVLNINYYQNTYTLFYGLLNFHHPSMVQRINCL